MCTVSLRALPTGFCLAPCRGFVPVPHRVDCLYIAPHNLSLGRPTRQSSTYSQKFSYMVRAIIQASIVLNCLHTAQG
jgi:hypothetical protein